MFTGGTTRKHAFSVGEEIAGRVERVEQGTVIVDLFGKATAIADVNEPRELPVIIHDAPLELEVEHPAPAEEASAESAAPVEASPAPLHTPLVPSPGSIPTLPVGW